MHITSFMHLIAAATTITTGLFWILQVVLSSLLMCGIERIQKHTKKNKTSSPINDNNGKFNGKIST